MSDAELALALDEAIAFHREVLDALPARSHARLHGRHAKALAVLCEIHARMNAKDRRPVRGVDFVDECEQAAMGPIRRWWLRD